MKMEVKVGGLLKSFYEKEMKQSMTVRDEIFVLCKMIRKLCAIE